MDKKKIYYNIPNTAKIVGRRISKTRQGNSKIFKNLSEFPIEIHLEGKENQSIGAINRPHSSLLDQPHKNLRIESAMSHYPDQNKKRLSLDSTNKKHERDSLLSRNSMSKKASKNYIVIDETKNKMAEDRRRYNNSCGSALEERSRPENRKKMSTKVKRPSIYNLHLTKKESQKGGKKEEKSLIVRDKTDKSKSKSKNKKKKKPSNNQLDKSKASTTAIGFGLAAKNQKKFLKKKQSVSTAAINLPPKEVKQKKKKNPKKVSEKVQIQDQFSHEQYPINKYQADTTAVATKKYSTNQRPPLKIKSKSKSRKGSTSKDKHKKTYSLIQEIDYASCINIPSNSSGLINSLSHSSHNTSKIKIIDHFQYRYFVEQNPTSVNLEEIRYYETNLQSKKLHEEEFIDRNFKNERLYVKRKEIEAEISEEYPNFNELQLKFLSSVVLIQRKWREYRLYRQIFINFNSSDQELLPSFIEKSNSKQLSISNGPKSTEKGGNKQTSQIQSVQAGGNMTETTPFSTVSNQQDLFSNNICNELTEKKEEYNTRPKEREYQRNRLSNQAYIQGKAERSSKPQGPFFQESQNSYYPQEQRKSSSSKEFCLKSQRYEFLQSEIFPNMTYILLKKQQLKLELIKKLSEINQLHHNDALLYDQYMRIKAQYERQYERKLKELNKSKQDIKKGYLKFIDTYKDIKHQALRKVSSQSGLMSSMYKKIFAFDQHQVTTPSDSSESLKKLTKKILIRKQFYLTQKIEPFIYNTSQLQDNNHLSERLREPLQETLDLSARCFRSRRERVREENMHHRKKEMFLDIENLSNDRLQNKRIREGYVFSPQFQKEVGHSKNLVLSFSKSDQLLPLTIKSPRAEDKQYPYQHYPQNYERKQRLILQELIAFFTHELYTELVKIDERRQSMAGFAFEEEKIKYTHIKDLEMIEESRSQQQSREQKSDEFQIVQQQKFREIYKIQGLQQRNSQLSQRRHRNSKQHNISPASSEKLVFDCEDILAYSQSFFLFLTTNHLVGEIVLKLNKNQGFTPLQYLKFLRDFEIPDDEYDPLISNQTFIEWQDYFCSKYYHGDAQETDEMFIARQSITIFHRCIFEAIIFLLEEHRPCGEKGVPFPWENTPFFNRKIDAPAMQRLFQKCLAKLQAILKINCGIVDEKYLIYNEEDLQRIHEENEDKIINMLERELDESPHNWFQVEEHCLEIKLELQCEIMEYLMLQALDEVLQDY